MQLLPKVRGVVVRFDWIRGDRCKPLFRGTDKDTTDVLEANGFPLAPLKIGFAGQFACDGRQIHRSCMNEDRYPAAGTFQRSAGVIPQGRRGTASQSMPCPARVGTVPDGSDSTH